MEIKKKITALTSGGIGDIIYAIPCMRKLGVTDIYVKLEYFHLGYSLFDAVKYFLVWEGFAVHPYPSLPLYEYEPGIHIDFDMDLARKQNKRGRYHIMVNYARQFKIDRPADVQDPINFKPWLKPISTPQIVEPFQIINLTPRWRENSRFDWRTIANYYPTYEGQKVKTFFVGSEDEWLSFNEMAPGVSDWMKCIDIMSVAWMVYFAQRVYCNQSAVLALAQGYGKKYYCEFKPGRTNCRTFLPNENILK